MSNRDKKKNNLRLFHRQHGIKPHSIVTDLAIGLTNPKFARNVASAVRGASCYGASHVFYTGNRVRVDIDVSGRIPREERMRGYADVEWMRDDKFVDLLAPGIVPVAVEFTDNAENLFEFEHPEKALYIFGPEDGSIDQSFKSLCHRFVYIPTRHCLNLATAVTTVLYDRSLKQYRSGQRVISNYSEEECAETDNIDLLFFGVH